MSIHRPEGWEGRLAAFVAQARARPFVWGKFDCCLMPCDAVQAVAGIDPAAALRGRYSTDRGALRALRRFAGGGLTETVEKIAAELDAPEVSVPFVRRGDVVLINDRAIVPVGFDAMLGVCLGRDIGVMQVAGLRLLPVSYAARAWRVG